MALLLVSGLQTCIGKGHKGSLCGPVLKERDQGRSQDGVVGGHGIRVSSQLGHLPGTGGGLGTPKGTEEPPATR